MARTFPPPKGFTSINKPHSDEEPESPEPPQPEEKSVAPGSPGSAASDAEQGEGDQLHVESSLIGGFSASEIYDMFGTSLVAPPEQSAMKDNISPHGSPKANPRFGRVYYVGNGPIPDFINRGNSHQSKLPVESEAKETDTQSRRRALDLTHSEPDVDQDNLESDPDGEDWDIVVDDSSSSLPQKTQDMVHGEGGQVEARDSEQNLPRNVEVIRSSPPPMNIPEDHREADAELGGDEEIPAHDDDETLGEKTEHMPANTHEAHEEKQPVTKASTEVAPEKSEVEIVKKSFRGKQAQPERHGSETDLPEQDLPEQNHRRSERPRFRTLEYNRAEKAQEKEAQRENARGKKAQGKESRGKKAQGNDGQEREGQDNAENDTIGERSSGARPRVNATEEINGARRNGNEGEKTNGAQNNGKQSKNGKEENVAQAGGKESEDNTGARTNGDEGAQTNRTPEFACPDPQFVPDREEVPTDLPRLAEMTGNAFRWLHRALQRETDARADLHVQPLNRRLSQLEEDVQRLDQSQGGRNEGIVLGGSAWKEAINHFQEFGPSIGGPHRPNPALSPIIEEPPEEIQRLMPARTKIDKSKGPAGKPNNKRAPTVSVGEETDEQPPDSGQSKQPRGKKRKTSATPPQSNTNVSNRRTRANTPKATCACPGKDPLCIDLIRNWKGTPELKACTNVPECGKYAHIRCIQQYADAKELFKAKWVGDYDGSTWTCPECLKKVAAGKAAVAKAVPAAAEPAMEIEDNDDDGVDDENEGKGGDKDSDGEGSQEIDDDSSPIEEEEVPKPVGRAELERRKRKAEADADAEHEEAHHHKRAKSSSDDEEEDDGKKAGGDHFKGEGQRVGNKGDGKSKGKNATTSNTGKGGGRAGSVTAKGKKKAEERQYVGTGRGTIAGLKNTNDDADTEVFYIRQAPGQKGPGEK